MSRGDALTRYHDLGSKCELTHAEHHYPRVVSHIKTISPELDVERLAVALHDTDPTHQGFEGTVDDCPNGDDYKTWAQQAARLYDETGR